MGRKPISILKAKDYDIYPFILRKSSADKDGFRGINIRIIKQDKTLTIDIECYDDSGVRVKCLGEFFEKGKIIYGGNPDKTVTDDFNAKIVALLSSTRSFVDKHSHLDRDVIIEHLYGKEIFINSLRRKRRKYETLPIYNKSGEIVDTEKLTSDEIVQLLAQTELPKDLRGVVDSETGESTFQSKEDIEELVLGQQSQNYRNMKLAEFKAKLAKMSVAERFQTPNGFDKKDIFLLFYSIKYAKPKFSGDWIVVKFFDYKERANPKIKTVKDLTYQWFHDFLKFLFEEGYSNFSTIGFSPFNYNKSKILDAPILQFTDATFEKYCKWLRSLIRRYKEEKKIPKIKNSDIKKLTPATFGIKSVNIKTRKNESLFKEEFDKLFYAEFTDEIEIRSNPNPKSTRKTEVITATKQELEKSRDIFILMTWLGGLRPIEYTKDNVKLLRDGKGNYYVNYWTSDKNKTELENPVINYSDEVLKKYNYKLPFLPEENNEFKNAALLISHLRIIVKQVGLDREYFTTPSYSGKATRVSKNIKDNIHRYFARKTFIQILRDKKVIQEDIEAFTGHSSGMITAYYTNHISWKRDIIEHIKPENK